MLPNFKIKLLWLWLLWLPGLVLAGGLSAVDFAQSSYSQLLALPETATVERVEMLQKHLDFAAFANLCLQDIQPKMPDVEYQSVVQKLNDALLVALQKNAKQIYEKRIVTPQVVLESASQNQSVIKISGPTLKKPNADLRLYLQKSLTTWKVVDFALNKTLASRNCRGSFNRTFRDHGFAGVMKRLESLKER